MYIKLPQETSDSNINFYCYSKYLTLTCDYFCFLKKINRNLTKIYLFNIYNNMYLKKLMDGKWHFFCHSPYEITNSQSIIWVLSFWLRHTNGSAISLHHCQILTNHYWAIPEKNQNSRGEDGWGYEIFRSIKEIASGSSMG